MRWIIILFSLLPFGEVLGEDPEPGTTPSGAEIRQREGKPDIYFTSWSHADELQELAPGISILKTRNEKTRELVNPAIRFNFDFMCPGDSFLVGVQSNYYDYQVEDAKEQELGRGQRRFRFACAFLQDNTGVSLRKTPEQCLMEADNSFQQSGSSACEGDKFVGGYKGIWDPALSRRDHQFFSKCCAVGHPKPEFKIEVDSCETNKEFHKSKENFGMTMCGTNKVIRKLSTKYTMGDGVSDRVFSRECCSLKVVPAPPKEVPGPQ